MRGPFVNDRKQVIELMTLNEGFIYLQNYNLIAYILNHFGHSIHRMHVLFDEIDVPQARKIIRKINDNCAKSLETLSVDHYNVNLLHLLKNEFSHVNTLTFSTILTIQQTDQVGTISEYFNLNIIFPNLITLQIMPFLHLDSTTATDWTYIDGHFPKLNVFSVKLDTLKERNTEMSSFVSRFLQSNSQIANLTIENGNSSLLTEANNLLPHLEMLSIKVIPDDHLDNDREPIHLNTVKYFSIELNDQSKVFPQAIFHQLHALHVKVQHKSINWMEFLTKQVNSNLSELSLNADHIRRDRFMGIPEKQKSLRKVAISCDSHFGADDIVQFIGKSKKLIDLEFTIRMEEQEYERLTEIVPLNWNLEFLRANLSSDNIKISLER